jgi:acyl-CoA dehydrogenase
VHSIDSIVAATASRIFADYFDTALLHRAASGEWPAAAWAAIEDAGLPLALVPESAGGFGASTAEALELVRLSARHAAPIPLAETLLANRVLAAAGLPLPGGPLTVGPVLADDTLRLTRQAGSWRLTGSARRVPWGRNATAIVLARDGNTTHVALLPAAQALVSHGANLAGEPRDSLTFDAELLAHAVAPLPAEIDGDSLRLMGAAMRTVAIAGALERVLEMTVEHARERVQFGKSIGSFQAIQHQLAIAAGEVAAAGAAADMAIEAIDRGTDAFSIAAAKGRASEAAGKVVAIAQQVHGAIGVTREHALHFYTTRLLSWREEFGNESEWYRLVGNRAVAAERLWALVSCV